MAMEMLLNKPLDVIKSIYDENPAILKDVNSISQYFQEALREDLSKVPLINYSSLNSVRPNSLVRYRAMVQDMFDPEYYLGMYEVVSNHDQSKRICLGLFHDVDHRLDVEEVDFDSKLNVTLERQVLYCVPVPAACDWIQKMHEEEIHREKGHKSCENLSLKRSRADSSTEMDLAMEEKQDDPRSCQEKRFRAEEMVPIADGASSGNRATSVDPSMLPHPVEKDPACIVKVYSQQGVLKLNEIVEFLCVYSVNPALATVTMCDEQKSDVEMATWIGTDTLEEDAVHRPPPSLVPRLHCLYFTKLDHFNPLVPVKRSDQGIYSADSVLKEVVMVRTELLRLLTKLLCGDRCSAEFLLMHLISKVYGFCGSMPVGKLAINLYKCPTSSFSKRVVDVIQALLERCLYLPLTLDNLNKEAFLPKKDYEANRLVTGKFQLAKGTHVVVDETLMEAGNLDSNGVNNLTALGNVIQWQKVDYDFKFHKMEMEADYPVLILSEGASMLSCDCKIPLLLDDSLSEQKAVEDLLQDIRPLFLPKIRAYLTVVKSLDYSLSDEVRKALEDDFVEMRKENPSDATADSFYLLLTMARYMAISFGQTSLSAALWTKTKDLDSERRSRIAK